MRAIGDAIAGRLLAMAGRKSPWGGSGSGGAEPPDGPSGDSEPPSGGDGQGPKGPRNPWLPPGDGPRRSASI